MLRKWFVYFLSSRDNSSWSEDNFVIEKDFESNGERIIRSRKNVKK